MFAKRIDEKMINYFERNFEFIPKVEFKDYEFCKFDYPYIVFYDFDKEITYKNEGNVYLKDESFKQIKFGAVL